MAYEHNDIVTVDRMNEAIAEGGGGGGGSADVYENYTTISGNINSVEWFEYDGQRQCNATIFVQYDMPENMYQCAAEGGTLTLNGSTYQFPNVWKNESITENLPTHITDIYSYVQYEQNDDGDNGFVLSFTLSTDQAEGSEPEIALSATGIQIYGMSKKLDVLMN